jgi:hypothetical protein
VIGKGMKKSEECNYYLFNAARKLMTLIKSEIEMIEFFKTYYLLRQPDY